MKSMAFAALLTLVPTAPLGAQPAKRGQFIHQYAPGSEDFGTITAGKSADLIMLAANPLRDVRRFTAPS